jgi:catechol 2,3-dioxygenase-like lactoylglutathione lyase family enzyme
LGADEFVFGKGRSACDIVATVLKTLDHIIVCVQDLDSAVRSYTRILGRTPSWRGEHPGAGTLNALFRIDNTYLELLAPDGAGPVGDGLRSRLSQEGEGLAGLAFGTPDADACYQAFVKAGLNPLAVEAGMGRDVDSGAFRRWRRIPLQARETRGVTMFALEHLSEEALLPPSSAFGPAAASVHALDHVVVQTGDPEATKALYGEKLGLRLALDRSFPQWNSRMLFFRIGGATVEVVAGLGQSAGAKPLAEEEDQLWGLCWRVADADAARARLAEEGFGVSEVREGRKRGTRVFTLRDGSCGVPTLVLEADPNG